MVDLAFYFLAALALCTALAAVLHKELVIAALNLVLMMLALAGIFLLLSAPFLAALQVIVYSGAIMVLFIFAIMLLNAPEDRFGQAVSKRRKIAAAVAALGFFLAILKAATGAGSKPILASPLSSWTPELGSPIGVSTVLLKDLALPFEIVSVLLTIAMLGAILLAKRKLAPPEEPT